MKQIVNIVKENGKVIPTLVDVCEECAPVVEEIVVAVVEEAPKPAPKKRGRPKKTK